MSCSSSILHIQYLIHRKLLMLFRTKLAPVLTQDEVAHLLIPRAKVVNSYVLKVCTVFSESLSHN